MYNIQEPNKTLIPSKINYTIALERLSPFCPWKVVGLWRQRDVMSINYILKEMCKH
jgi:hypothetical protein